MFYISHVYRKPYNLPCFPTSVARCNRFFTIGINRFGPRDWTDWLADGFMIRPNKRTLHTYNTWVPTY